MRRVPRYLIIGNGQMASHMCHYFHYLSLPFLHWYRKQHTLSELQSLCQQATHVLVLIHDSDIDSFIQQHLIYAHLTRVHFSGVLSSSWAHAAHPLCMFQGDKAYSCDFYQKIAFCIEQQAPSFNSLLPGLTNPHFRITSEKKTFYHALCVLANNFSTLLWEKFYRVMTKEWGVDAEHLTPFLKKTFENIQAYPETKFTGPLARQDQLTLNKNLMSLQHDEFHLIYKSFMQTFGENTDESS